MFLDGDFEIIANGWNDGERIGISSGALSSAVVEIHEGIHGRIFSQTSDGQLHKLCIKASNTAIDEKNDRVYSKTSTLMFLDSRTAHEAGATYLSIQSLPTSKMRKDAYGELSRDYKYYYNLLSQVIDPLARTSWMRYALGWTLIHWSFHSTRISSFFSTEIPSLQAFTEAASPTDRLEAAIKRLKKKSVGRRWAKQSTEGAKAAFANLGREIWDITDEVEWNRRAGGSEDIRLFENLLTSEAGGWLLDNLDIETHDFTKEGTGFGPGFDKLMTELGLQPVHIFTKPDSVLDAKWNEDDIERLALSHANDVIEHQPGCVVTDLTSLPVEEILQACSDAGRLSSHLTVLSAKESDDSHIILCFRKNSDEDHTYSYSDCGTFSVAKSLAPSIVRFLLGNLPSLEFRGLFKTDRETILESAEYVSSLFYHTSDAGATKLPGVSTIFLYMTGPWNQVYKIPNVEVGSRAIALVDVKEGDGKPISFHVARLPDDDFLGVFVTLKPSISGHRLRKFERLLAQKGQLRVFEIEDQEIEPLIASLRDAWHVWERF